MVFKMGSAGVKLGDRVKIILDSPRFKEDELWLRSEQKLGFPQDEWIDGKEGEVEIATAEGVVWVLVEGLRFCLYWQQVSKV